MDDLDFDLDHEPDEMDADARHFADDEDDDTAEIVGSFRRMAGEGG
jgi:hypothetical protein